MVPKKSSWHSWRMKTYGMIPGIIGKWWLSTWLKPKFLASSWELLSWVKRTLKGSWPTFQFLLSVAPQRFDRLIRKVCQDAPMVQLKDIRKELKYGFRFSNVEMAFQFIIGLYHSISALHLLSIVLENATKKTIHLLLLLFQCKKIKC